MVKIINSTVKFIFTLLLGLIVFGLSYKLVFFLINSPIISLLVAVITLVAITALFVFSATNFEKLYKNISNKLSSISTLKLAIALGVVCLVTKIGLSLIFNADSNLHSDMKMYISFADQISHQGVITENTGYASTFSYTLVYGLLLSPVGLICGSNPLGYAIALSVLTSIVMVLFFDILRKYAGNTTAFVGLLIYNLLPMGLFQTQVVIHETTLMFFHILAFWILQKVFHNKYKCITNAVLCVLAATLATLGSTINAAGRVILISLAIYSIAKVLSVKITKANAIKVIVFILCILLVFFICFEMCKWIPKACKNTFVAVNQKSDTVKRIPYGWALYVGSNYETHGTWNQTDAQTYDKYLEFEVKEDAYEYQRNLLEERFSEYKEQPLKIPAHLIQKTWTLWSPYFPYSAVPDSPGYQSLLYSFGGLFQKALFSINHLGYIVIYLIALLGMFNKKYNEEKRNSPMLHFMMVPLGVTAALLLFEVAPKYSSHMHILLFAIAIFNFAAFRDNISGIRKRIFKKD